MDRKSLIRREYLSKRRKKYFEINKFFFTPLIQLIKKKYRRKKVNISLYYPSSHEVNLLKILEVEYFKKMNFLLPIIEENNSMNFFKWKKKDILYLNRYGIPEPIRSKKIVPSIILVPLLAFDKKKNRLGYGKGFYDKYLNKHNKKILTIGIAFSFQKHQKLPVNVNDFKLDYIITERGII